MNTRGRTSTGRGGQNPEPRTLNALVLVGALCLCAIGVQAQQQPTRSEFVPSFSTNTRVRQQVDRLQRLSTQKLWDEWLATYQQLVDDTGDLVLARNSEILEGLRYHCHQLLAGLPPQVRQRYHALYDGPGAKLYEKAAADHDPAGMREVYSRYRFTASGPRALLWIANDALDSGRPELARVAYGRLAKEPGVSAGTLLRYALAADAAGKPAEARQVLDRVRKEFGGQPVQVEGEKSTGTAAADRLQKALRQQAPPVGGWISFAGRVGDRNMGTAPASALKKLWEYSYPTTLESVSSRYAAVNVGIGYGSQKPLFSYLSFPIVAGDHAYIQGPRDLSSVKLSGGAVEWGRQDFSTGKDDIPNIDVAGGGRGSGYRTSWLRPMQAAPAIDGRLLVARVPQQLIDRESGRQALDYPIVGLDARTGMPLWRRFAGGTPRGVYYNTPSIEGNTVLTGVATNKGGITEFNAVALDASTGEPLWSTYLGAGSDSHQGIDGSPAAVQDGTVWIESSLYTVNALDLITGEIRWIYHYTPVRNALYRTSFDAPPPVNNEPISLIATPSGPVVFAPRWSSHVIAIKPSNGELAWDSPKGPGDSAKGALFAVDAKHAYVCSGDRIQAINMADGAPEWSWEPQGAAGDVGYASLCGERIYALLDGKIHLLNAATGKELDSLDISAELGDGAGFGATVAQGNLLLLALKDRVLAFGPK